MAGCTQQFTDAMVAGALGGALGGPLGGVAAVQATQPLPQGWEWQQPQDSTPDLAAQVAAQTADDRAAAEDYNTNVLISEQNGNVRGNSLVPLP